ncbi:MAG: imelysin family protein, partial [Desulfobulbia bacterium]
MTYKNELPLRSSALKLIIFICLALPAPVLANVTVNDVLKNYADIAEAKYKDSLETAKKLQNAVQKLVANPTKESLNYPRRAWLESRIPYQQTEVYRFGNAIVDDWEGRVNAWPLDEGLIDYVTSDYGTESEDNELYVANVISNPKLRINGNVVEADEITKDFLQTVLHEAGGIEANVATGYHAIEFLLWGQDTNGTRAGAGNRPATDFSSTNCTGGSCERRVQYLLAVTDLLVDDLTWMVKQWSSEGKASQTIIQGRDSSGLIAILRGMGSLSYGELAGERMKLGLILHDPEEEHDCFSDNTHNSHYYDTLGIQNVYLGRYKRVDGTILSGTSLSDLVKKADPALDKRVRKRISATLATMKKIVAKANSGEAYDQLIGEGNAEGNQLVQSAIDDLIAQA